MIDCTITDLAFKAVCLYSNAKALVALTTVLKNEAANIKEKGLNDPDCSKSLELIKASLDSVKDVQKRINSVYNEVDGLIKDLG